MEWWFQNERNDWPRCNSDFETARLRGIATPGSEHSETATAESRINPRKNGNDNAPSVAPDALL
jgi:hypothetical protein